MDDSEDGESDESDERRVLEGELVPRKRGLKVGSPEENWIFDLRWSPDLSEGLAGCGAVCGRA